MPDANAGAVYGLFIADQLSEERSRKNSLEARGLAVITTSGTLATLLFALTAGLTSASDFKLPSQGKLPLILALLAFGVAASLGLVANVPLRYKEPTAAGLAKLVNATYWTGPAEIAQLRVAEAQVTALATARSANGQKVAFLLAAMFFELFAVACLVWAIAVIL